MFGNTKKQQNNLNIGLQVLPHAQNLSLPSYATEQSAGLDLSAAIDTKIQLAPGQRALVPTGIAIALPPGYEAQIRPRSGLAAKNGVTVLNTPRHHRRRLPRRDQSHPYQSRSGNIYNRARHAHRANDCRAS
jgi:hypothetical protein